MPSHADENGERPLIQRAVGFSQPATKIGFSNGIAAHAEGANATIIKRRNSARGDGRSAAASPAPARATAWRARYPLRGRVSVAALRPG